MKKENVVQFESFSSIYNENLQNELKKSDEFNSFFELEVINLEREKYNFEISNSYEYYNNIFKLNKIIYWLKFNKYLKIKYYYLKGSIVDIQFADIQFFYLIPFLKSTFNKIVLSFWGSDLLRLDKKQYFKLKNLIKMVDVLSFETSEFSNIFIQKIGKKHNSKMRKVRFGINLLKQIDLLSEDDISRFARQYEINQGKQVVAIGYNRGKAHQHLLAIDSIINANVDPNLIHLVIPWTYGPNDEQYKDEICRLIDGKYTYSFIDNKLTDKEIASLRKVTDIMIQVQTTDVMSSSMLETLYAKNIIITGSWLPYNDIYDAGVVMNKVDEVAEVGKMLTDVLEEHVSEDILEKNKQVIGKLYSWESCISAWIEMYK